ncbi:beta-N-acetylhexosaminidase [Bacillus sp. FJAT-45350]|uniref:beta-N-acetylhexosaminidase n=1 Tax=Bacillus sp. FJAT-45350 TaxID=2011014 RepID=UPI000BB926CD|nr:beta-N-acetylhexosaminidase [Bacillus sp. FJAT-45350]
MTNKIKFIAFCLLALCLISTSPKIVDGSITFSDIENVSWAEDSIYYLVNRGTVAGYGQGRFGPNDEITRGQAVAYLTRELGKSKEKGIISFHDVGANHYFASDIANAVAKQIIGGYPDGTFRPNDPITRAETASILTRAYELEAGNKPLNLSDLESAKWAKDSLHLMASNGLIGGYTDGTFRPNQNVTRAEFASFLTRIIQFQRNSAIQASDIEKLMSYMTLEEKVGQMLMPDIRMYGGKNTTRMNPGTSKLVRDHYLGGIILFDKNIENTTQMATFTNELQKEVGDIPLFISMDQEGGAVTRLSEATHLPGNMALGATRSAQLSYEAGRVLGAELKALGVNLNFAPVLDVNNNPENPIIGIRSFGENPQLVGELGTNVMRGIQDEGVIATVKHFPGHGDTSVDSHLGLPVLNHSLERLRQVELLPFKQAFQHGVDMVMTAHITFPSIDDTIVVSKKDGSNVTLPATLSKKMLTDILRKDLQYNGVVVTDAFTMKAIADHFGEEEAVIKAIIAGADIILMPQDTPKAFQAIVESVKKGALSSDQIDESVERILTLKMDKGLFQQNRSSDKATEVVGSTKHKKVATKIAESSTTLVRNEMNSFPYTLKDGDHILIAAPLKEQAEKIKHSVTNFAQERGLSVTVTSRIHKELSQQSLSESDIVLLATYHYKDTLHTDVQKIRDTILSAEQQDTPYVVLSLGNPYDLLLFENAKTQIATYGDQEVNIHSAIQVVFGQLYPKGVLPVTLQQENNFDIIDILSNSK